MSKQACELKEVFYMNPYTGTINTKNGWHPYTPENSELVYVVQDNDGKWVSTDKKEFTE